ncbi:MAG: helix-turn-helix transcriptional regulator [Candidatus Omnitrophica bacterium]|nr:helix-turn-helix transcriptional regulator [Candidatus Omnitrophota bacterium]MBI2495950.1 helix-turn-helix transcriptional regulator [Candidatus Omnitrophota bacterium]MBI3082967.1 helix-turn-helix transcriptional regulator [Candidatus Omnitrophota bacterium]
MDAEVRDRIERLKTIRKRLGWSEEVCAYHLGVTYSTLNRWERGESFPKSRVVLKAIDYFIATHERGHVKRG